MMLIDDVLKITPEGYLAEAIASAICFDVDNVGAYFYDQIRNIPEDEETYHRNYSIPQEIPNAAPLADSMWFEYAGATIGHPETRCGVLVKVVWDAKKSPIPAVWDSEDFRVSPDARWALCAEWFAQQIHERETPKLGIYQDCWSTYLFLKEDGGVLQTASAREPSHPAYDPRLDAPIMCNEVVVALLAICFAHCKGITKQEHKPSRQVRRAAERKGRPYFTFHTLNIRPVEKVLREEGDIQHNGITRALHICRGHFSHYTAEKPLFGKHVGTYYVPMHVRGSAEKGVRAKNYKVYAEK